MKYYTLGSNGAETKSSGFTAYADMGISEKNKIYYTQADMKKIRAELETVHRDLKLQTKRCRHLVAEYTRKLQEKEQLYQNEKALRDNQLAKVLKALLIFEARLKQEQKLLSHQLSEKDFVIKAQTNDIRKLLANTYCKNCNQYYPITALESCDSSSEYIVTESSNLESLDSSSDTYGAIDQKSECDSYEKSKTIFMKNRYNSYSGRRRKSTGTYFEVLKLRNESPVSNEDNTSADYDNLDSLPPESVSDKISVVSENIENMFDGKSSNGSESSSANVTSSECGKTVINTAERDLEEAENNKLTETISVFESGAEGHNDNSWYASASDQEDEERSSIYRNNPVLECMNQILLQNINDINSPPKTPNIERKSHGTKRVKFCDQEENKTLLAEKDDYYETPIQKIPNFYETPQSIYSNDYEQILSKSSECSSETKPVVTSRTNIQSLNENHHYIEMEKPCQSQTTTNRKNKIQRTPPALPPKPPNLVAKGKIQQSVLKKPPSELSSNGDLEPDYCSISELNLPQQTKISANTISVVAEVHSPTSNEIKSRLNIPTPLVAVGEVVEPNREEEISGLTVKKCVEKLNIQLAKQTCGLGKPVEVTINKKKNEVQIPKLPQVSEIIIPDDPEENEEKLVSQDNYVKNNTQILQQTKSSHHRKPIVIGSSVSSLISGFQNNQLIEEIKKRHERMKSEPKKMFSSFENPQNSDKLHLNKNSPEQAPCFENFDLSQNFEEFKLDDCEIEEYDVEGELELEKSPTETVYTKRVDYIRATDQTLPNLSQTSIDLLKKQLELRRSQTPKTSNHSTPRSANQPTYEHFLECTGLSSKSILTPPRGLTNHKHMLKPKDIKLRSRVRANTSIFERYGEGKIKYWSEPFV
ncbi:uncharacterized protein [Euwallacea fornicatus]|uniref:uncharacterized protein n=1 Tax=Euwallacea fornicatus TaxID=995702 RepID=UPI00338DC84A